MLTILAQISPRTDMLFRGILIPGGLLIAYIGWRAIRSRQFIVFHRVPPVQGKGAIFFGILVILAGLACSIVSVASFFF